MNVERQIYYKEGGNIGKLLIMEFSDNESAVFSDIMNMLERYPNFHKYKLKDESILSLPGIEIRLERRKIYSASQEISLTAKEFDILCMLAVNRGRVVTYEQIYQNVWNEYPTGGRKRHSWISCPKFEKKTLHGFSPFHRMYQRGRVLYGN